MSRGSEDPSDGLGAHSVLFRVYFPKECLCQGSAMAVGFIDETDKWAAVTGLICPSETPSDTPDAQMGQQTLPLIGVWINGDEEESRDSGLLSQCPFAGVSNFLCISKRRSILAVRGHPDHDLCRGQEVAFLVILYDSSLFLSSNTLSQLIKDDDLKGHQSGNIQIISGSLARHQAYFDGCDKEIQKQFSFSAHRCRRTLLRRIADFAFTFPDYLLTNLLLIPSSRLSNLRFFQIPAIKTVLETPSTLNQMKIRYGSYRTDCRAAQARHSNDKQLGPRDTNNTCRLFGDVCLGLFILAFLCLNSCIKSYADLFISWAETVAVQFESLLHWLMGVPAGFKVNEPLAYFLGHFFLYHIFLWKAYLRTLRPFWSDICYYSCLSGCLGLTIQLSLLQDLISMMTIHIYCFYVYAARLYHLQIVALSSLWRLFCGKKLNVLRKRIDSASYDIDQLFAGTLFFTILLFTFPTTTLFYLVFAVLRLIILSIQGVLSTTVSFMNNIPVHLLFLRFFHPSSTAGHLHASVMQHEPLCIYLQLKPLSFRDLFRMSSHGRTSNEDSNNNTWTSLGKKLLLGELIYPWIEPSSKPNCT